MGLQIDVKTKVLAFEREVIRLNLQVVVLEQVDESCYLPSSD